MSHPTLLQVKQTVQTALSGLKIHPEQVAAETAILLEATLGVRQADLWMDPDRLVPTEDWQQLEVLLARRVSERVPVQYLVGQAVFYGLTLAVTPAVLIPRPETELLVDTALEKIAGQSPVRFLDLGTGSGAIVLAMAHRLSQAKPPLDWQGVAVDCSEGALAVARQNGETLGLNQSGRLAWRIGDLWGAVAEGERFEVIVSNPPYIDPGDLSTLAPEVAQHEPHTALFSPEGPLAYYRRLAQGGRDHLSPGGWLLVEVGAGMGEAVSACFEVAGLTQVFVQPDYAGLDRVVGGCWPPERSTG
jgi:release factor glutamine methyltransferase